MTENVHEYLELEVDLSDAAIQGSEQTIRKIDREQTLFELRKNQTNFEVDAYLTCQNNTFFDCNGCLSSQNDAFKTQKDYIFKKEYDQSESVAQIEKLDQTIASGSEDDKSVFMHGFHSESLQEGINLLT